MVTAKTDRSKGLVAKDFIFMAIFGVLTFMCFMACSMILGANAYTYWFTFAVGAIPAGVVWMYLAARVPKRGAILITSVVIAAVALLMGMVWSGPAGIVVGGLLAEVIADPQRKSAVRCVVAFAVFVFCFWFGVLSLILVIGPAYIDMLAQMGMSAEYGQSLLDSIQPAYMLAAGGCTLLGGVLGGLLGRRLFKKHFEKISA